MRREILFTLLIASCVGCGGVGSVHPLSDDSNSVLDERLFGKWQGKNEACTVTIRKMANTKATLEIVSECADKQKGQRVERAAAFAMRADYDLLSVRMETGEERQPVVYWIARYGFRSPDTMELHPLDRDVWGRAVERGDLTGEVTYSSDDAATPDAAPAEPEPEKIEAADRTIQTVLITTPREQMLEFLRRNLAASFEVEPYVLRRVDHGLGPRSSGAARGIPAVSIVVALVLGGTLAIAAIVLVGKRQRHADSR